MEEGAETSPGHEAVDVNRVAAALSSYIEFRRRHEQRHSSGSGDAPAAGRSSDAGASSRELVMQVETLQKKVVMRNRYISTLRDFIANELVTAASGGERRWHNVTQITGKEEEAKLMALQDTIADMQDTVVPHLEKEVETARRRLEREREKRISESRTKEQVLISLTEKIAACEASNKELTVAASKYSSLYEREAARAEGLEGLIRTTSNQTERLTELLSASDRDVLMYKRRSEELAEELLRYSEDRAEMQETCLQQTLQEQEARSKTVSHEEHEQLRAMYDRLVIRVQQLTSESADSASGSAGNGNRVRRKAVADTQEKSRDTPSTPSKEKDVAGGGAAKFMLNQLRGELAKSKEQLNEQHTVIKGLRAGEERLRLEANSLQEALQERERALKAETASLAAMRKRERKAIDALQLMRTRPTRSVASQTPEAQRRDAHTCTDAHSDGGAGAAARAPPERVSRETQTPRERSRKKAPYAAGEEASKRGRAEAPVTHYRIQTLPPAASLGSSASQGGLGERGMSIVNEYIADLGGGPAKSSMPSHSDGSPSHSHRRLVSRSRSPQRAASPDLTLGITATPLAVSREEVLLQRPHTASASRGRRPASHLFSNERGAVESRAQGERPLTVHIRKIVPAVARE